MSGPVLVLNTGSTSVKLALVASDGSTPDGVLWRAGLSGADLGGQPTEGIARALRTAPHLAEVEVVGHRVVHGADRFTGPVRIDAVSEAAIAALIPWAPTHQRAALDGLAAARQVVGPEVAQVAVFDTTFHHTLPAAAAAFGGPHEWLAQGWKRYGFHGISHDAASREAAALLGRPREDVRLVTCHLGGGCSLAAVDRGRSVDTTMGFTPLDGLVMASRSGTVDPGLLIHLMRQGTSVDELTDLLEKRSGLLGLSGVSADLREVIAARDGGNELAALAVDVFVHRIAAGVAAMAASLGVVDAVVFTGGIGQHSVEIRDRVMARLPFLGADVAVLVVPAREELAIAAAARAVMATGA